MTISERLFEIMRQQNISMPELSRMTGISRHTIFDWQRRGTNPGADKIMVICEALHVSPEQLLTGRIENTPESVRIDDPDELDIQISEGCKHLNTDQKKRVLAYLSMLQNTKK